MRFSQLWYIDVRAALEETGEEVRSRANKHDLHFDLSLKILTVTCAADEEADADDREQTKKVKETVWDWELLNDNKAIWLRNPAEVEEGEYTSFFESLSKVST